MQIYVLYNIQLILDIQQVKQDKHRLNEMLKELYYEMQMKIGMCVCIA